MDKYLSIITNFGCHYSCPYCIVRENNLHIPKTTIEGLQKLIPEIQANACNWVSISGGGDPLFQYAQHKDWYETFFNMIPGDAQIEMHTSYVDNPDFPYGKFTRVVYHVRNIEDLKRIKRHGNQIVRAVFVVTADFTEDKIDAIAEYVKNSSEIDELSFRQMVDNHYQVTHYCQEYLENGHQKNWWYIKQNDYNLYYCENVVSYTFEDFKINSNES